MIAKATGQAPLLARANVQPNPSAVSGRMSRKKRLSKREQLRQAEEQSSLNFPAPTTDPVFETLLGLDNPQPADQSPNALAHQGHVPLVSPLQVSPAEQPATSEFFTVPATAPDIHLPVEDETEETIVVRRPSAPMWTLEFEAGFVVPLGSEHVVVGRKPEATDGATTATIQDPTKTLSRSHARLRWDTASASWTIEDLGSANGVETVDVHGFVTSLTPSVPAPATEYLNFGGLRARLVAAH